MDILSVVVLLAVVGVFAYIDRREKSCGKRVKDSSLTLRNDGVCCFGMTMCVVSE